MFGECQPTYDRPKGQTLDDLHASILRLPISHIVYPVILLFYKKKCLHHVLNLYIILLPNQAYYVHFIFDGVLT